MQEIVLNGVHYQHMIEWIQMTKHFLMDFDTNSKSDKDAISAHYWNVLLASANGKGKYAKDYVAPNISLTPSQMNCSKETVKIITAKTHKHQKEQVCGKNKTKKKTENKNSQKKKTNFICAENVEKNPKMGMKHHKF